MSFHYLVLRPLNSGGYGDLYLGQRSDNGLRVVIKYLREFRNECYRRGFQRAVRLQGRQLPGVVPLLGADTNAERPYCVMAYLEGGSLAQYAGRLSADQLHAVAVALARIVANIHAANEIHGDFKPDNILVSREGHIQVADPLGAGSLFTKLFSANRGGTPGYWAPEIHGGASISFAGDLYSYGATLHHLVTGQRPQDGVPLDVNSWAYESIPKVREIVAACCQANPQARPAIAEVLQMFDGRAWAEIQAERAQREQALAGFCFAVGLIALIVGLAHGQANA